MVAVRLHCNLVGSGRNGLIRNGLRGGDGGGLSELESESVDHVVVVVVAVEVVESDVLRPSSAPSSSLFEGLMYASNHVQDPWNVPL